MGTEVVDDRRAADEHDRRRERIAAARRLAGDLWTAGAARWQVQQALVSELGCRRQEAELLVAEQAALARIAAFGLDPSAVRHDVDQLLAGLDRRR